MPRSKYDQRGVVATRLMLEMMKSAALVLLDDELFCKAASDVLLCSAIWVGHAEGRPMTAGKLATYVGMPRATVIRRLEELERRELVCKNAQGRWTVALATPSCQERLARIIEINLQHMRKAASDLSKMDSGRIAAK